MRRTGTRRRATGIGLAVVLSALLMLALLAGTAQAADTEFRLTGDIYLGPGDTADSLVTMNGDITVEGHVRDAVFTANGDIHVLPGGRVDGDAVSLTGEVLVDEAGAVLGETVQFGGGSIKVGGENISVSDPGTVVVTPNVGFGGAGWFFWLLGGLGLGLLLVLLSAGTLRSVGQEVATRPGRSTLIGVLSPLGLPIIFIVLLISVIGIPIALLLFPFVLLMGMFGLFAIAMLAGRRLLDMAGKGDLGDVWAMAAGVVLVNLVGLIPVLGTILWVIGGFVGFGATVSRMWDSYQARRAQRAAMRNAQPGPIPPTPGMVPPPTPPVPPAPTGWAPPAAPSAPNQFAAPPATPTVTAPVPPPAAPLVPPTPVAPPAPAPAPPAAPLAEPAPPATDPPVAPEAPGTEPPSPDPGPRFHI